MSHRHPVHLQPTRDAEAASTGCYRGRDGAERRRKPPRTAQASPPAAPAPSRAARRHSSLPKVGRRPRLAAVPAPGGPAGLPCRLWRRGRPRYLRSCRPRRCVSRGCLLGAPRHVMAAAPPRPTAPSPPSPPLPGRKPPLPPASSAGGRRRRARPLARARRVYLSAAAPCGSGERRAFAPARNERPPAPRSCGLGTILPLFLGHKMEKRLSADGTKTAPFPTPRSLEEPWARGLPPGLPQVEVGPALTRRSPRRGEGLGDTELL